MKDKDMDTNDLIAMRTKAEYCTTTTNRTRIEAVAAVLKQFMARYCRASTSYEEQAILADMTHAALLAADAISPASGGEWPTYCIHGRQIGDGWCPDCRAANLTDTEVADVAWKILQALHENVPEEKRPMSWSDVAGDQEQRIRAAAVAAIECIPSRDAASSAPAVTEEWQPIETAPKDGRRFLTGYFDGNEWRSSVIRWKDDRWHAGRVGDCNLVMSSEATHWRPLPAPPTIIRGEHK